MNIFTKLRRLREAIEEVYSVEEANSIVDKLMEVLEIDRASISFHLGNMVGNVISKIIELNQSRLDDMEQAEGAEDMQRLRAYYDAKSTDLYALNAAIIAFMTAFCNTKELD